MVIMETPKSRKLRRVKGSSKKKRHVNNDGMPETTNSEKHQETVSSDTTKTPPRRANKFCTIVERGQEEVRGVEWQYHGKYVESDVPVVWGSPHGSPIVNAAKTVCESPGYIPKRKNKYTVTRKCNYEENEPPQFLNEILALSEKIKAQEESNVAELDSPTDCNQDVTATRNENELDESYSNLFDESMNECMIQCSQEVEKSYPQSESQPSLKQLGINSAEEVQEKEIAPKCQVITASPKKKVTTITPQFTASASSGVFSVKDNVSEIKVKSPRVGNKNYVLSKRKFNTYIFEGRVLGSRGSTGSLRSNVNENVSIDASANKQKESCSKLKSQSNVRKQERNSKPKRSLDISFETVKESFLDDDIEFLSTLPEDLEVTSRNENESSVHHKTIEIQRPVENHRKELQNTVTGLDDSTYFEDDEVFQFLDSVESNVAPSCSQNIRCTPEEIEKKRQEAKLKLEKKKKYLAKN